MSISLTRDEFVERLNEREKLFELSIIHDIDEMSNLKQFNTLVKVQHEKPNSVNIELSQLIGTLARKALFRAIDLVYQDNL